MVQVLSLLVVYVVVLFVVLVVSRSISERKAYHTRNARFLFSRQLLSLSE